MLNFALKKKNSKKNKEGSRAGWIFKIIILAFGLSVFFSFIAEVLLKKVDVFISLLILLAIIAIGIVFDIIGVAVTSASETPFHAMAADRIRGGKEAVKLIRNADKVSNFCNDVIGDISGIISGTAGAAIILKALLHVNGKKEMLLNILMAGVISILTIGGKAMGKSVAINNSKAIVYAVALFLSKLKAHFIFNISIKRRK